MVSYKFDKIDKAFLALTCILVTLICCMQTFCEEVENVETITLNNMTVRDDRNFFSSSSSGTTAYFPIEKGYIYTIEYIGSSDASLAVAGSSSIPAVNDPYNYLATIYGGNSFSYIADSDTYLFISYSWASSNAHITRTKIPGMNSAINDLVDNVGMTSLWNSFENVIPFVGVAVVGAFGFYLIFHNIKEVSNGKEKMF